MKKKFLHRPLTYTLSLKLLFTTSHRNKIILIEMEFFPKNGVYLNDAVGIGPQASPLHEKIYCCSIFFDFSQGKMAVNTCGSPFVGSFYQDIHTDQRLSL